jgi:hypothetical protein
LIVYSSLCENSFDSPFFWSQHTFTT